MVKRGSITGTRKMAIPWQILGVLLVSSIAISCGESSSQQAPNTLTAKEKAAGWQLAFDGKTLNGWRGVGMNGIPTGHWKVEDGAIRVVPSDQVPNGSDGKPLPGGDLMLDKPYRNFEFSLDWKIPPEGNSGVKYNVSEEVSTAGGGHGALGFEYQIIDDVGHPQVSYEEINTTGCLYALVPPPHPEQKILHPVGEWNHSRIVFNGMHGEHWLNGVKLLEFEIETPRMDSLIAASKYHSIPDFGKKKTGYIVLQDHASGGWFRNIKIRSLDE